MNKKTRPAYLGVLLGVALIGLGVAYEELWCDPRELLQEPADPQALHRLSRDGVTVEFEARPLAGGELREGAFASIRFKVSDQTSGQPLSGMAPGAWIDPAQSAPVGDRDQSCKARVALFLKSSIGARPLLDLNSYFLLMLNKDASLTVIDPTVSVGGVTSTMARIELPGRPMDWAATGDDKQVFVSIPERGKVAVITGGASGIGAATVRRFVRGELSGPGPLYAEYRAREDVSQIGVLAQAPDQAYAEKLMPVKIGLTEDGKATPALQKKLAAKGLENIDLATLDLRQSSDKHEAVVAELLAAEPLTPDGRAAVLNDAVGLLEAKLRTVPVLGNVSAEGALPRPELQIRPRADEAARLGITTVDVGVAQLSMHSARELTGVLDPARFAALLESFLSNPRSAS